MTIKILLINWQNGEISAAGGDLSSLEAALETLALFNRYHKDNNLGARLYFIS